MGKNINTVVAPRTAANLYSGKYADPNITSNLNEIYRMRNQHVGFGIGSSGLTYNILSLGASAASLCLADCSGGSCCEGKQDYAFNISTARTAGVVSGSFDVTITFDPKVYTSGFSKVGFFFGALSTYGSQIVACCPLNPAPNKITYTLKGYNDTGVLADDVFVGAIAQIVAYVNNGY